MKKLFVCAAVLFACAFGAAAQDWSVSAGSELTTQYLWRGFAIAESPTIVPTFTLNYENEDFGFEVGYCSITELQRSHYLEMDFWAAATFKGITFMALEQGCGNNLGLGGYDDNFELTLSYELPFEILPATISWNTFVAGDDYNLLADLSTKRAFSSYVELDVPFEYNNFSLDATVGATPFRSDLYDNEGGFKFLNLSLKAGYNLPVGDSFELPVYAQYTYNPLLKANYFMLGCKLNYTIAL
ncbi:MAG: hypothetical protein J5801_05600 [Bacteroidales bacterium]|nr:hypothetical protein [Bacteroidales bacterium]